MHMLTPDAQTHTCCIGSHLLHRLTQQVLSPPMISWKAAPCTLHISIVLCTVTPYKGSFCTNILCTSTPYKATHSAFGASVIMETLQTCLPARRGVLLRPLHGSLQDVWW